MNNSSKNKVAVVILNWNGVSLLEKFLPSIVNYSDNATIYVVDNNSSDTSVSFLQKNFPTVTLIQNQENYGFAGGYTIALQHVEEEIYALVNSDIEVTENWLQPIIELFDNEPETAIIQPKILDYKNKDYFEYAGAGGGFIDKFGYPFCRGRIFTTIEKDNKQYDDTTTVFWASGACLFIRKSVFQELGGFDTDFFAHQEEIDLCWRAFNANHTIKYCGKSTVFHLGGATLEASNPKKTYLNFRNSLLMLVKNLPAKQVFQIIIFRLILDGVAGVRFLFLGKFQHFIAILKAHFSFYIMFPKISKKRVKFIPKKYYSVSSIVLDYYWAKKRYFKDLF
ncbi:glycosyltransferase family 2 protein [Flavobacterium orientale]|uniref:Glycosyl transferase family 2 n=1 Tax=Flavobacterium orientale TaxID=1756020 RepID=A0A916Y528_9FLAO|nr:glycosyltransferase family 2 protein [Flavobacterium orientale]GGD31057.1 glycosyl transferase family 2 [Flavobacterium orientale]